MTFGNTYATTQSKSSILNSNVTNAPRKKYNRIILAQKKCEQKKKTKIEDERKNLNLKSNEIKV